MKFRKKPITIEAIQWTGDNIEEIGEFLAGVHWATAGRNAVIPTREGDMAASPNDWIIKGVAGEFYPCKPDIFEATYEPEDARPSIPGHADTIEEITRILKERFRPDSIDVHIAIDTPDIYEIELSSKSSGLPWSFWVRVRNGQIKEYDGVGGSWSAAQSRTQWIMEAVTALVLKDVSNFHMRIAEL